MLGLLSGDKNVIGNTIPTITAFRYPIGIIRPGFLAKARHRLFPRYPPVDPGGDPALQTGVPRCPLKKGYFVRSDEYSRPIDRFHAPILPPASPRNIKGRLGDDENCLSCGFLATARLPQEWGKSYRGNQTARQTQDKFMLKITYDLPQGELWRLRAIKLGVSVAERNLLLKGGRSRRVSAINVTGKSVIPARRKSASQFIDNSTSFSTRRPGISIPASPSLAL
jgi:hypothetical protein